MRSPEASRVPARFRYRDEAIAYKEEHLKDRQLPQCYVQYMIAIINNCQTFRWVVFVAAESEHAGKSALIVMRVFFILSRRESINSLKRKYSQSTEPNQNDAAIEKTLSDVAKEGCQFLLDEVFLDLEVRVGAAHVVGPEQSNTQKRSD